MGVRDMEIISLKNMTKKYNPNIGCFNINIAVKKGEVYGFLGPNGAGKTTVIRQMVGFIKSDNGTGTILGYDVWKDTKNIMKDLGYLAGEVNLPEYMTGISYLKTISEIRGNVDWKYVEKLIEYFDFDPKQKIKKMSKGMKQKVAIISAFMHKPKVLILDEPTSGLDPLMQQKFDTLIKNLQKEEATIFMSSHIFSEIDNTCDKVAIIKKGKIVSEANIKELKNNADKIYELKFITINDYDNFMNKKWKIIDTNKVTKIIKVEISQNNINNFLKEITDYQLEYFKELPFNLEQHFIKFYEKEVSFND
ncbi:ATP-binding cassette domain-containing protein [Spiroplasma citri]|uniref:ATP-binding cassette domain-containing protein n=3 Tax=Spiroplasma citri TaxID=2133 RepID=A0A5B8XIF4_SPICI|nr:ABC transporter ATP-binding protein [Spiroplasma citri]QED24762.1 ABC transporter ATP-binding protein [Spiroplasma citri]QIA69011.1 ATP-binding cassette domain-containing protein [Spiroplasma citri]QIA69016.1 ATP-binding cassette domain-containing protein [Spiroplasma citri]QIA71703.1 ATP-binding cassette domain-containing protein [Spiroplasma citri]